MTDGPGQREGTVGRRRPDPLAVTALLQLWHEAEP